MKAVKIDTIIATAIIWHDGINAKNAMKVAKSFARKHRGQMGGGQTASVSVATDGGRWHNVGSIGNHQ